MLVFVKKPDGNVLEIEVGPKAVGLDCLDLVSFNLDSLLFCYLLDKLCSDLLLTFFFTGSDMHA